MHAEEHHATNFDPASFFTLHDFNSDGRWEPEEILRTYGLFDDSNKHVTRNRHDEITREVMRLVAGDDKGFITRDEWVRFVSGGKELPDFGTGPGHHGDDEYEYEIHHWEK